MFRSCFAAPEAGLGGPLDPKSSTQAKLRAGGHCSAHKNKGTKIADSMVRLSLGAYIKHARGCPCYKSQANWVAQHRAKQGSKLCQHTRAVACRRFPGGVHM